MFSVVNGSSSNVSSIFLNCFWCFWLWHSDKDQIYLWWWGRFASGRGAGRHRAWPTKIDVIIVMLYDMLPNDLWSDTRLTMVWLKPECDISMDFDTNEYPNIFVLRKWYERISEYIRMKFLDTNEYPNIFILKFWYERISE